jgi:hypothetical protein
VQFVDVCVELVSVKKSLNRTMVIKKKDGKWYVHPAPHTASLLSAGLNDEEPSAIDFKDAHTIKRAKPATAPEPKPDSKKKTKPKSNSRAK